MEKQAKAPQLPQMDVKSRFFAQYWGQLYEFKNTKTKWRVNEGCFPLENGDNERLILTDLKNITDEDCLFVGKCLAKMKGDYSEEETFIYNQNAKAVDYLRSKGYALPFMEYSVDDLVKFDWVRLV